MEVKGDPPDGTQAPNRGISSFEHVDRPDCLTGVAGSAKIVLIALA